VRDLRIRLLRLVSLLCVRSEVERAVRAGRREFTDYISPLQVRQMLQVLNEYVEYCNEAHQSRELEVPMHLFVERVGELRPPPVRTGLHHRYYRAS
jgi:hypothetical protein